MVLPEYFPDEEIDHNFCRSPSTDPESRPWCFTGDKDKLWEFCAVYECTGSHIFLLSIIKIYFLKIPLEVYYTYKI